MWKHLMKGLGIVLGLSVLGVVLSLSASPAVAFQCPTLIKQANDTIAKMKADDPKLKQAKDLVAEAQRLHDSGQHAESVKRANDALALLGAKAAPKPPARRGY